MSTTDEWPGRWSGLTVACIASGPSLTPADCDLIRAAGLRTIVTNTTFRLCPWADVLFAFDTRWWQQYRAEVESFAGLRFGYARGCTSYGARAALDGLPWFRHFHNSGASSISIAIAAGAARIILLGFDCQTGPKGQTHWHGDHPKSLGNARSISNWPTQFRNVARFSGERGVDVVNCSRTTALQCFPRSTLEAEL